jgi:hypothetical protein
MARPNFFNRMDARGTLASTSPRDPERILRVALIHRFIVDAADRIRRQRHEVITNQR